MLETGLAIIALNMPSIWGLRTHAPVETFLRSLRSLTSLHSLTSHREQRSYSDVNRSRRTRKEFNHLDQDIELAADSKRGQFSTCSATIAGDWQDGSRSHRYPAFEPEMAIEVRKSVDLQEIRMAH